MSLKIQKNDKVTSEKVSRYTTVVYLDGCPFAIFSHRKNHVVIKDCYDLNLVTNNTNLSINSANRTDIDRFYKKLGIE